MQVRADEELKKAEEDNLRKMYEARNKKEKKVHKNYIKVKQNKD